MKKAVDYNGMLAKVIRRGIKIPKVLKHDKGTRPSSIYDLCIRERIFAYNLKVDVAVESMTYAGLYYTSVGTEVHRIFQDEVMTLIPILKGNWKCETCKTEWENQYVPENCDFCEKHNQRSKIIYQEYYLEDTNNQHRKHVGTFGGSCDGVICLNRLQAMFEGKPFKDLAEKLVLLEIKTGGFRVMQNVLSTMEPPEAYKTQATSYQRMSNFDKTMFLYIGRDNVNLGSFLYTGEDRLWTLVQNKLDQLEEGRASGTLPVHKECTSSTCSRAKACPFRDMCFGFTVMPPPLKESPTSQVNNKKVSF